MTVATRGAYPRMARPGRSDLTAKPTGLGWVIASEGLTSVLGFLALMTLARRLGPDRFSDVEFATAVTVWLLVLVRGGFDVIVTREAARKVGLVAPLTDLLLGLRLVSAVVAFALAVAIGWVVGPPRETLVVLAGLVLFGSAGAADLWPRALGRLGWIAVGPVVRALAYYLLILELIRDSNDATRAVICVVIAEGLASLATWWVHRTRIGPVIPRWRGRASRVLAVRGVQAGLIRFGRVTLFGLDLLAMGGWRGEDVGEYAAARRVVFALVGLGMVLPATLGPSIARAWMDGSRDASARVSWIAGALWTWTLPATIGLAMTADRTMPILFGPDYADGGCWLVIVTARLPWLLASSLAQTALVACRREALCLRLVAWQT
ncbi:MAG: oligosaccharide flippase family protein, partial [Isosphaeraceae bacterium]